MKLPPPCCQSLKWFILALSVATLLPGCDNNNSYFAVPGSNARDRPTEAEQIAIGPARQYRKTGLDDRFVEQHRFVLVSRPASGGQMLVALRAVCPNDHATVRYDDASNLLRCPRCNSRWTTDGLIRDGSLAKRSLPRLRLNIDHTDTNHHDDRAAKTRLLVDPSRLYRKRDVRMVDGQKVVRQEWSATDSMYMFAQDPRHRRW